MFSDSSLLKIAFGRVILRGVFVVQDGISVLICQYGYAALAGDSDFGIGAGEPIASYSPLIPFLQKEEKNVLRHSKNLNAVTSSSQITAHES